MKKKFVFFDLFNIGLLSIITLICLYPFINIVAVSFSDGTYVMAGKVYFYPLGFTIETYKTLLFNPQIGVARGLWNSLVYSSVGTIVAVLATFITAYCLSRKRFLGRYFFMLLILFTMIFDGGLIPSYLLIKELGMVNTMWVMIIPGAISAWLLILTRSFLDSQPVELEESAFIDGASDFQIMYKVFLPLSAPIVATISLFYAVAIWNNYLTPLIFLQDTALHPIQLILAKLVVKLSPTSSPLVARVSNETMLNPKNLQATIIVLGMLPILMLYPFVQKYFTKGIMIGAVKG